MKLIKLVSFLGLSLISMQCFANKVVCGQGYSVKDITTGINEQIVGEKISLPVIKVSGNLIIICVTTQ